MANRFWVGGTGDWSDTAKWSTTSGGAGGASVPVAADVAIFDANSDTAGAAFTATVDTAITITTLTITTVDVLVTIAGTTNLTVTGGGTWSASSAANGVQFTSAATFGGAITLTSGTLNITDITFTASIFSSSNSNTRSVAFGTSGKIVITGNSTTIFNTGTSTNLTYSGTPLLELNYSGSTGTRTVTGSLTDAAANNVISIRVIGGTDTIELTSTRSVLDLNFDTFAGTMGAGGPRIWGSLTLSPSMTITPSANGIVFYAPSGTHTVTSNGVLIDRAINFGIGTSTATFELQDNLTLGNTRTLQLVVGTLDANGQDLDVGQFNSANSNVRTLKMGSGDWTLRGQGTATVWNTSTATNLTVQPDTSTVYFASATTQNINGGGITFNDAVVSGSGAFRSLRSNFAKFSNTVSPVTILFGSGETATFTDFAVSGTPGNQVTLSSSTAGSQATLSQASGTVNASYLTIQDINATGGATWDAFYSNGNNDAGNNTGWNFGGTPAVSTEVTYSLRSFTTPRRF
jgi:hypothetical protein